jgi:hypothetical protein
VAFASRMIVYVGFLVYAFLFYRNVADMPVEAKTMPLMAVIGVAAISLMLLVSDVYRAVRGGGTGVVAVPLAVQDAQAEAAEAETTDTGVSRSTDGAPAAGGVVERVPSEGEPAGVVAPADEEAEPEHEFGGDNLDPYRVYRYAVPSAILVAAYIFFLPILGYLVATTVFLIVGALVLGSRSWVTILVYAPVTAFAFQWLFENLLKLRLP